MISTAIKATDHNLFGKENFNDELDSTGVLRKDKWLDSKLPCRFHFLKPTICNVFGTDSIRLIQPENPRIYRSPTRFC